VRFLVHQTQKIKTTSGAVTNENNTNLNSQ
jgi:hypothetical protein